MSEQLWVERARAGDQAAFSRLVEAYQNPIYNLCYRMLGEAGEAEDAAQEAFLRAYSRLVSYNPARPFKTWLFSIASHHCIDRLRKRRLIWLSLDEPLPANDAPSLAEPAAGPEERVIRGEQAGAIQKLLTKLSPDDRAVIVMRYWYDLSYEDMAEVTGATISAVKSRLHRARASLGEMMQNSPTALGVVPALPMGPALSGAEG